MFKQALFPAEVHWLSPVTTLIVHLSCKPVIPKKVEGTDLHWLCNLLLVVKLAANIAHIINFCLELAIQSQVNCEYLA